MTLQRNPTIGVRRTPHRKERMRTGNHVLMIRSGRRASKHGALSARHPTCRSTSRTPAARLSFSVGMRGGRGSQLKTLAPHTPEWLVQRALRAAAVRCTTLSHRYPLPVQYPLATRYAHFDTFLAAIEMLSLSVGKYRGEMLHESS